MTIPRRLFCLSAGAAATASAAARSVRDAGAKGDGTALDTAALQRALDGGPGVVVVPAGVYRTGTLRLRSHVTLLLERGARLLADATLDAFPRIPGPLRTYTDNYFNQSLLYAEDAEDIGIEGSGVIDGQGRSFPGPYLQRPNLLRFVRCRDVGVSGVTFVDAAMWVQHYLACSNLRIDGITVRSRANKNNDGIDIDCCERVRIANCHIDSGDDAIVLKSTAPIPCRDVVIQNCTLSSACNALKLGTESNGGFEDIAISNCSVYDTRLAGLAIEMVDGGKLERVVASNLVMRGTGAPLFVRLGNRARPHLPDLPKPGVGTLRHVSIQNVQASRGGRTGCAIAGLPGHCIEELTLRDITLGFEGGGEKQEREIPEQADRYPEFSMFGPLPAYGVYLRHVRGLLMDNVRCHALAPDGRPAIVEDDVERVAGRR